MRYALSLTMLATLAAPLLLLQGSTAVAGQAPAAPAAPPLALTTTAFPDGGVIPDKYTQAGEQVSPALTWTNVPAGTVSFVLNMRDPDVARNKGSEDQVHWLVWGIPGTAKGLTEGPAEGADAAGRQPADQRHRSGLSRTRRSRGRPTASLTPSSCSPWTRRST
jgi:phosphatidylethanolamine-binding protein (PEBP) family uncharacterized protein